MNKIDSSIRTKNSLGELYDNLKKISKLKFITPKDEGFTDFSKSNDMHHEAGFDSYITGCAFLIMKHTLGDKTIEKYLNYVRMHSNRIYVTNFESGSEQEILNSEIVRYKRINNLERFFCLFES